MVKKEKVKRIIREIAAVPIVLTEKDQVRHTLSWSDDQMILDIRHWYQVYDWKTRMYTGEYRPGYKGGFCFVATDEFIDANIEALKKIKEIKHATGT